MSEREGCPRARCSPLAPGSPGGESNAIRVALLHSLRIIPPSSNNYFLPLLSVTKNNKKKKSIMNKPDSSKVPSTFLVTLSGENKSGKSLVEAVAEVSVKHKELNPCAVLFYSDIDEETLFGRLMECMFDLDLFLINLETGQTVSCLEDYSFLAESKGVRVVKDSEEGAPGEEED